jgi:ABC-type transporter Mla MlaB component
MEERNVKVNDVVLLTHLDSTHLALLVVFIEEAVVKRFSL